MTRKKWARRFADQVADLAMMSGLFVVSGVITLGAMGDGSIPITARLLLVALPIGTGVGLARSIRKLVVMARTGREG